MVDEVPNDDEARRCFVDQINELSRASRREGAAPSCAAAMAEIIAENEAECSRMEQDLHEQEELEVPRLGPAF